MSTLIPVIPDWSSIIRLSAGIPCTDKLLPPTIDPADDIASATQQVVEALGNLEFNSWPEAGTGSKMFVRVSSITASQDWIEIGNNLIIDISSQKDLPENVNVLSYHPCGGEGKIRAFSPINLAGDFDTYSLKSSFTEFDFFTLQPGEFEDFMVPFTCEAVGIFQIKVNVSYVYSNIPNVTNSDQVVTFICPQTFTRWVFNGQQFMTSVNYRWNGTGYEEFQ